MKPLIALSLLFLCSTAWACGSYEDCITSEWKFSEDFFSKENNKRALVAEQMNQTSALKAIAYKLDEISRKLDSNDAHVGVVNKFDVLGGQDYEKAV